jgi:hypothetical protein
MPALTVDGVTYPCRRFAKRYNPVATTERTWGNTMVSSRQTANSTALSVAVVVRSITEAQKNTLMTALLAPGSVDIAGDQPGGTLTVHTALVEARPLDRQSRWEVDFVADVVDP